MGRCYEFGVAVQDGCEHAMVVVAEGGACACSECGAHCTGQFNACSQIVSMPGYVPVGAPRTGRDEATAKSSVPAAPQPAPTLDPPRVPALREPPTPAMGAEIANVRSMLEALLDRPDRTADAVQAISHELAVRDEELADAFGRLTAAFERIGEQITADREAREQVVQAVRALADRIDSLEQSVQAKRNPIFGFRRDA